MLVFLNIIDLNYVLHEIRKLPRRFVLLKYLKLLRKVGFFTPNDFAKEIFIQINIIAKLYTLCLTNKNPTLRVNSFIKLEYFVLYIVLSYKTCTSITRCLKLNKQSLTFLITNNSLLQIFTQAFVLNVKKNIKWKESNGTTNF